MKHRLARLVALAGLLAFRALAAESVETAPLVTDNAPILRTWIPPVYPADALKEKIDGTVQVRFIVDAQGRVTTVRVLEAGVPQLNEAALAAVRGWEFLPGIEDGKPAAYCLDVPVEFSPAEAGKKIKPGFLPRIDLLPQTAPHTDAEPKLAPPGEYPAILSERKIQGEVAFACVVSAEGRAVEPRITGATHAEFVLPALVALTHWEFTPALQGDLPVKSALVGKVTFNAIGNSREEILAVNGITAPDGSVPPVVPEPYMVADPVWPFELLLKGVGGSAVVEFEVRGDGTTTGVKVREATPPEFGRALAAALESWTFNPAVDGGQVVTVPLVKRAEFKPVPAGKESAADPVERLVAALRANQIGGAKKLDERLTPIYRAQPTYPVAFPPSDRPAGRAEIEFVIDREGRARLPRIVSATREEFGWAAATAVAQWVFKAPRRGGEPVDVLVKIPFEFSAPVR